MMIRPEDLKCRCRRKECDAAEMEPKFLSRANALVREWGAPFTVTSGVRCPFWNEHEGGAEHSLHLVGNAVDFWFSHKRLSADFAALAEKFGFMGIGLGDNIVHIDDRAQPARWRY